MRPRSLFFALALAATLCAPLARAQKFQEPSREELQMTADPKAPGAPAVYLFREEKTDNYNHYVSEYARIKVLTELGKEWATVEVPYIPGFTAVPIIEARTIHADGTVIPLQGKAEDLLVKQTAHSHVNARVFNMPSVEVGSILEYRWTIPMTGGKVSGVIEDEDQGYYGSALASSIPEWEVQQPLFIHKEHFYYQPFNDLESNVLGNQITWIVDGERATYLLFTERMPAGAHTNRLPKGDFSLDVENVPAIRHEANTPPNSSFLYRVRFFWTPANSAQVYWDNEQKRWSKQLDSFASVSDSIRSAAAQIAGSAATPEAKARALYAAVQALENTDFARAKSEAERKRLHLRKQVKNADQVLGEKSGSGNDLAALYLALARAAGLEAYGLKVADRDDHIFDVNYLSLSQLDSLLVVVKIDGKDIYLDPGQKQCPFGQLAWSHVLTGGLQQNVSGPTYTPPNPTKDAITAHAADLTLDPSGNATGTLKILMNGPAALHWRQLALTHDPEEVKKQLNESLHGLLPQGVAGEVDKIQGLETSEGFLSVAVKLSGQLGTVTGKRIVLPGFFFSTGPRPLFVAEEHRESPIDLHYAEQVIDDAIYHLPAGYTVESAPQPAQLPWPDHATLVVKTQPGANQIEIKHVFARNFILLDPKEYPALRDYYQKLATTDQQKLVLAPGAGN